MSEAGGRAQAARSRLRPGFIDLLAFFLITLIVLIGGRRLFGDADAATHVATGSWILEHREIPRVDPFSGTRAGTEWFAHEWMADLGSALAYRACGWNGLVVAAGLVITVTHLLLFRFLIRRGDDVLAAFGAVVAAAAAWSSHWLARPHLMTSFFLAVCVIVLEQVVRGAWRPRALLFLPPIALVWANVHGGFLVLFGVLACYGLGALLSRGASRSLLLPLMGTFTGAAACVMVNPWGWRLPGHLIAFFAFHGPALLATSEFMPAAADDRAGIALFVFAALCAVGIACGLMTRAAQPIGRSGPEGRAPAGTTPLHPGLLLALALTTGMAFRSIRHVDVMAIFGALVISGGLSRLIQSLPGAEIRSDLEALRLREERSGGVLAGGALVLLPILAALRLLPAAGFDPAKFPVGAVSELKRAGPAPAGPIFAPDVWGGYLILEWPQARVFVDGRWDMYGDEFFQRYADLYLGRGDWSSALDAADVTLVLLPRDAPLVQPMRASADWIVWRSDRTSVVFKKRRNGS